MEEEPKIPTSSAPDEAAPVREEKKYQIRTMASDLAEEAVRTPSQPERPPSSIPQPSRRSSPSVITILIIAVLILGAAAYALRAYRSILFPVTPPPITLPDPPPPFFGTETTQTLTVTAENKSAFAETLAAAVSQSERTGSVKRIILILKEETGDRYGILRDLFSLLDIVTLPAPTESPLMIFAYYGAAGPELGFATKTNDPDRVLDSLRRNEEVLYQDFEPLFLSRVIPEPGLFEDYTYRNTTYRFLLFPGDSKRGIAYMVFPSGKYLVVATSRESMERIIERLFDAI